jgi:hypothetical protein
VIRQFIQHPSPPLQPQGRWWCMAEWDKRKVNINDNMDVSSCFVRRGQQSRVGSGNPVYTSSASTTEVLDQIR